MTPAASEEGGFNERRAVRLAVLAGCIVFSLLIDPAVLDPLRIGWLVHGDTAQSYLGWLSFRQEPWSLPLGATPRMGMEQASSIVYSDSIPLLVISLKLIQRWLPVNFQYAGLWLCACYALQGYFSCRLLALFTLRKSVLVTGVLLFLLSPIMLLRAQSHLALTAHWIVLAALYLYYVPAGQRRLLQWLALLWLAPWVHAYLMFMAYAIWVAYLLRYGVFDRLWSPGRTLMLMVAAMAGSLAMMWLAGYFMHMEVSTGGYGYYSMNLLAPLLPIGAGPFMLHAPAAATAGQYEGFNYLGLGVMLALAIAAAAALTGSRRQRRTDQGWRKIPDLALVLCCLALTMLALSTTVTLGSHVLFTLPVPAMMDRGLNIFRASGRMFWPVYYLLLLLAMRGATQWSAPLCARLLVLLLAIQLVDLRPFLQTMRESSAARIAHDHFPAFPSAFWNQAREHYKNIYVIPGNYEGEESVAYEYLAALHGFAIDTAYSARLPVASRMVPRQQRHALFFQGVLDPQGLYLVQPVASSGMKSAQRLFPPDTGVGNIDGFTVVAPGWFAQGEVTGLHRPDKVDYPEAPLDRALGFGRNGDGLPYLQGGWSEPGDGATWSQEPSATLVFHVTPTANDLQIALEVMPYLPAAYPMLDVKVRLNGKVLADWVFERGRASPDTMLRIPLAWRPADGNMALTFNFDKPRSPLQSGESADPRTLGLLLHSVRIQQR